MTSCVTQPSKQAQFGHPLPSAFRLWCQCVRQCWAMLPWGVHPTLLAHHFAGKEVGAVCLLMEICEHGRNESDALSEGPRSP